MAIAQDNIVLHSDINAIFSSFNDFIQRFGGNISQIPATSIPTQNSLVDDNNIALLNNKIDAFNQDEFLKTKDWWIKSNVTEGDLIEPINLANIQTTVNNFGRVVCRNRADNAYGGCDAQTCSHNCSQSCSHSSHSETCSHKCTRSCSHSKHSRTCSHNCSVSCSHSKHSRTCSNTCSVGCSNSTCGYSCANCGWVCAQNPETQGWSAGGVYCGPVTSSGIVFSHNGYTEYNYACFQRNNCNERCLNMIAWSGGFNWSCTWSGGTCSNTCSRSCSHSAHSETCSHNCGRSCSHSSHSETCSNNCSVACSHSSHSRTCSHNCAVSCSHSTNSNTCSPNTSIIDITCSQQSKVNASGL